ncbi:MAG: hypothetical protein KJS97_02890 [Alphaproteobacteria bacterium]|nr:hypothetical protein [Alphaproteobacteria bacterium]
MAKNGKARTPKRIAGVRIPKRMRRTLGPLARAVDTPLGRQVVAGAIVAAAVAAWRDERVRAAAARLRDDARDWLRQAATQALGPVEPGRGAEARSNGAGDQGGRSSAAEAVYGLDPGRSGREDIAH